MPVGPVHAHYVLCLLERFRGAHDASLLSVPIQPRPQSAPIWLLAIDPNWLENERFNGCEHKDVRLKEPRAMDAKPEHSTVQAQRGAHQGFRPDYILHDPRCRELAKALE